MSKAEKNKQRAVVLDWDGTVRGGFTLLSWVEFLKNKGFYTSDGFEKIVVAFDEYKMSRVNHNTLCQTTARLYAEGMQGHNYDKVQHLAEEFGAVDREALHSFVYDLIPTFLDRDVVVVILSGAPIEILEYHSNVLGIQQRFGLKLGVNNDRIYTQEIEANPGLQAQKKKYMNELLEELDIILAMGNSDADLPLLLGAKMGIIVNGSIKAFPDEFRKRFFFLSDDKVLDQTLNLLSEYEKGGI